MKTLFAFALLVSFASPSFAAKVKENALITEAETNGMFPVASIDVKAQIPCGAENPELKIKPLGAADFEVSVEYTTESDPNTFSCQSIEIKTFKGGIHSEMPAHIKLINAEKGVSVTFAH